MPLDKPIRAVALKWHNSDADTNGNYIGAIQLILENGCTSPVFRNSGQSEKAYTQVDISFNVKKV
jgi:hypothetical protein